MSHSMEKRKKSGQKLKNFFFGILRSNSSKRKMTFFSVFDLKNTRIFFLSFCPLFFRFSTLCHGFRQKFGNCVDIDECDEFEFDFGECVNEEGGFYLNCVNGYS